MTAASPLQNKIRAVELENAYKKKKESEPKTLSGFAAENVTLLGKFNRSRSSFKTLGHERR